MYGKDTTLALCFQDSYGTAQVDSPYFLSFLSEGLWPAKEQLIEQGMQGRFDEGAHHEGINSIEGDLQVEANPISLGALLAAFFDVSTVETLATGVYKHHFVPRTSDFDASAAANPVTLVKDFSDGSSAHLLYDMVASKLALAVSNGEFLTATLSLMGGKYSRQAPLSAAYPDAAPWAWDVTSVQVGGAAKDGFGSATITLDESMAAKHTLSTQKTPNRIKRDGFRTLEVDGNYLFDDETELQQFMDQTEQALILNFKGTSEISSGYYEELTIDVPALRYTEFPVQVGGPGEIEVSVKGKGVYDVGSGRSVEITLVNTQAAYR